MRKINFVLGTVFLSLVITGNVFAAAKDPLQVAPDMYKLLFENDKVRVMEVTFAPGQQIGEHSHPDHFITVLKPGNIKIFKPDGTSSEHALKLDDVVWANAETHWAKNIGTTELKLLVTELKGGNKEIVE